PYELLHGRLPSIGFMRPFGCPVTILNTLDPLSKFQGKVDEGFLVGYFVCNKAFRVFNSRTRIVQETLHVNFMENKPNVAGSGPAWLFDINSLYQTMNYHPVIAENQSNTHAGFQDIEKAREEGTQSYVLFPVLFDDSTDSQNNNKDAHADGKEHDDDIQKLMSPNIHSSNSGAQTRKQDDKTENKDKVSTAGQNSIDSTNDFSAAGPLNAAMPISEDLSHDSDDVGAEADVNNLESIISVSPIPTTRIHKDHPTSQIIGDLSSTTQTRSMARAVRDQGGISQMFNEDFHTCMFACFLLKEEPKRKVWILVDLPYGKRAIGTKWVYRNKKDERGIVIRNKARLIAQGHTQEKGIDYEEVFAPVARIEAIRLFLAYASFMGFPVYQMDVKSAFLYDTIEEEVYVCQPPGFEDPENPNKVYKVVKALYGLHQAPRAWYETLATYLMENGFQRGTIDQTLFIKKQQKDILFVQIYVDDIIFVKRIFRYLKGKPYLGLWYPKDSPFDLVAYSDSDYAGASLDIKSTTRGCQFFGCRLISWQCKKQIVVATSSTEAEYVAAASGCCYLRNVVIEIDVISDDLSITTNGQTTTGKESSNPFMAGSLPKTIMLSFIQRICFHMSPYEFIFVYLVITSIDSPLLGVKTPRSDKDRLKLMELIVFLLQKDVCDDIGVTAARLSNAAEGFEQIIDFLNGSYIKYALTVSPHIYISCIKQFWNSVLVKRSGDVTRLQALVNKKKIVISEVVIREILQLNDAEGMVCLPNEEIFTGLAQIGYEKPLVRNVDSSSKFYMYPRFIQLIIQAQVGDLSTHTTRFISPALTQKVFANMRRVRKGFSGVKTPLFEGMIADRQPAEEELGAEQVQVDAAVIEDVVDDVAEDVAHVLDTCSALLRRVEHLEHDNIAQRLEIVKLKARVKKLEKINMVKSSKLRRLKKVGTSQRVESSDDIENVFNQGRIIAYMDQDEGIELVADQEKDAKVEGRHADKQAELYNLDLDHSSKAVAASTPIPAAKPKILSIAAAPAVSTRRRKGVVIRDPEDELPSDTTAETPRVKDKGKGILIEAPKPMKKKDRIEMDAEYARKLQEEINKEHEETYKNIDWNAALDHVQSKEPQYIKRYHGMKKKPQTESEARKNMIFYLKNTERYKMDFFKGMKYDEILPIFQAKFDANIRFLFKSKEEMEDEDKEIIISINETPAQKAVKRRKLHEQAKEDEDLKKQLEVVDDDVFIEATPIGRKVSVVDYEIVMINNKPRYKIIKADDTHQLYTSFITLLKNFDREDLEDLWRIVKARFSTSKPTNFSDDYLLSTLKTMFEKTDGQDAIWIN
nr:putative ribonuclease H-like domain-containing protein [Tanacetum cinerariifolium]